MNFNPVNSAVLTGTIVAAGTWSRGETVSMRLVIGTGVFAISLAVVNEMSPDLAGKYGLLVLVIAAFMYLPAVMWKLGLISRSAYPNPPKWG